MAKIAADDTVKSIAIVGRHLAEVEKKLAEGALIMNFCLAVRKNTFFFTRKTVHLYFEPQSSKSFIKHNFASRKYNTRLKICLELLARYKV